MNALAAYGLLAHALIFGAIAALLPLGILRPRVALAATAVALIGGFAPILHSLFGAPSLTLLQLAILQLADRTPSPFTHRPALGLLAGFGLWTLGTWLAPYVRQSRLGGRGRRALVAGATLLLVVGHALPAVFHQACTQQRPNGRWHV